MPKITFFDKKDINKNIQYPAVFKETESPLTVLAFNASSGVVLVGDKDYKVGYFRTSWPYFTCSDFWTYLGPADLTVKIEN